VLIGENPWRKKICSAKRNRKTEKEIQNEGSPKTAAPQNESLGRKI
jgi:hypothetical protein